MRGPDGRLCLKGSDTDEALGPCPLCGREMFSDTSDRHHLVPACHGGKETTHLHRICHSKVHHTLSEKQLEREFNTVERLLANEEMQAFVRWVARKDPRYVDGNRDTAERKGRRWR